MRKTATSIRCVPRLGLDNTQVRTVDLDLPENWDETDLQVVLSNWFGARGVGDAIYAIEVDPDGFFAVINDEAFEQAWGEALM